MELKFYFIAFLASFVMIFLKGFQQQNVIGGHIKMAFIFGYLLAFADICVITLVFTKGWAVAFPVGTGAAFGVVASMMLHRRYFQRTITPRKRKGA